LEKRNEFYLITESRLRDYRSMQVALALRCRERSDVVRELENAVSPVVTHYGIGGGKSSNSLTNPEAYAEKAIAAKTDLWVLNRDIEVLEEKIHAMTWALTTLLRENREVIEAFYFEHKHWAEIEEGACLSESVCRKRRSKAVWHICNILFTHRLEQNRRYIFVS